MNIKQLIFSAIALFTISAAQAQKPVKIAHINSNELIESLPQIDSIKKQLEGIGNEYQRMLDAVSKELQQKQEYWDSNPTTDQTILEIRGKEYQGLVTRYQSIQQEAQQVLSNKENELMEPVISKLKSVVQEVAKEKGYTYVFDSTEGGGLIYGDPAHDLIEAVRERLKTTKF